MDYRPAETPTVSVTVHTAEPDGQPGGPVAHGFLVCTDTALVPEPPEALSRGAKHYLVRISEGPGRNAVETIPLDGVHLSAVDGDGVRSAVALLTLAAPSRHATAVPEYTLDRLTACLVLHRGDLWATYADLGYPIARPEADGPGGVARERLLADGDGQAWLQEHAVTGVAQYSHGICAVCHCCEGQPKPDSDE